MLEVAVHRLRKNKESKWCFSSGEGNPYVTAVLDSVAPEAQDRGVLTEEALKERFIKVERICKRVSMIGDNGGSLLRYPVFEINGQF